MDSVSTARRISGSLLLALVALALMSAALAAGVSAVHSPAASPASVSELPGCGTLRYHGLPPQLRPPPSPRPGRASTNEQCVEIAQRRRV